MNPVLKAASAAKNFVTAHRVGVAIVTTAVITTAINVKMQRAGVQQWNEFLTEKGLIEEFYNTQS